MIMLHTSLQKPPDFPNTAPQTISVRSVVHFRTRFSPNELSRKTYYPRNKVLQVLFGAWWHSVGRSFPHCCHLFRYIVKGKPRFASSSGIFKVFFKNLIGLFNALHIFQSLLCTRITWKCETNEWMTFVTVEFN